MTFSFRPAIPEDARECVVLRGKTRQNAFSAAQLASIGVTAESWAENIASGALPGTVCMVGEAMAGYCFGDSESGEIVVLAVLPEFEGRGIGRNLLARTVRVLADLGHARLFLGCSPDPASRSHGFYRHLGWQPTGELDQYGDEVLELFVRQR